ncbi:MAG: pilus assembly protein [Actinobacteria bacterium]|nr:pilus assembly protein [Actinomycetota bacterium]
MARTRRRPGTSRLGRVWHHRSRRSDRAAALVEAAIILPVLMVFLLGIIEFGLVYATAATATGASRSGARLAAASFGPGKSNLQASANIVAGAVSGDLQALTSAVPIGMVVYKVDGTRSDGGPSGGFPASNDTMTGGCTSNCYRYTWNSATKQMAPASSPGWTMTNGDICVAASTASVGVWVLVRHSYLTQLIGKYNYVAGKTIMRLEPLPSDQC